jgi:hypothetical protein
MLRRKRDYVNVGNSTVVRTALDDVFKEIQVMRNLGSEHVLRLFEVIDLPDKDKLYISRD